MSQSWLQGFTLIAKVKKRIWPVKRPLVTTVKGENLRNEMLVRLRRHHNLERKSKLAIRHWTTRRYKRLLLGFSLQKKRRKWNSIWGQHCSRAHASTAKHLLSATEEPNFQLLVAGFCRRFSTLAQESFASNLQNCREASFSVSQWMKLLTAE